MRILLWSLAVSIVFIGIMPFIGHAADQSTDSTDWNSVFQDFVKLVKQIWIRITSAARIADQWLEDHLHISFSKIIRFIANIIIWILESVIRIIKSLVGATT